ncbi:enoyl-CoA hydratase-related protein [Nocardioides sp. WS12]|uniref:enoyl-CoA hydratase-related protein n=1 Tax=Nocardioides sp. WS12 TaxID=2486272 RepID=UPI0015FACB27|nr:enoyl-CoA hydratase-related protein [Nocardioides sp. WS12]
MSDATSASRAARTLVEGLYDALAGGDRAAIEQALTADFIGRVTPGLPFGIGGEHVGAGAMIRDGWFTIGAHWRVRAEPSTFTATADGRLQVQGIYRGTGRESGTPFTTWFAHVWEFRDGLICGLTQITDATAFVGALESEGAAPLGLETMDLTVADGVATLCLARPDARNAIDQRLADEFLVAAVRIAGDTSVRAVLICGEGPDLTVGGDIGYFTGNAGDDLGATLRQMTVPFHLAFQVLAMLDAPIVTVAQGAVAGGGLGFVYAADIVVAAEDARFVTAFAAIGLSGDGGGTWHLPRRIGPARAARAYLLNEPIAAQQALDWGLVAEVVPAADARVRGVAIAQRLANGPTRAFAQMRALLRESWDRSLPEQLDAEIVGLVASASTEDARGAIDAFLNKQRPTFRGL